MRPKIQSEGRWLERDVRVDRRLQDLEIENRVLRERNELLEQQQAHSSTYDETLLSVDHVLDSFITIVDSLVQQGERVLKDCEGQ
ncbi:hypothetical protein SJAG_06355 [Schizosaccharomyces japonicus yFS275]|uniref:Uncharacterized protein n=1 Tax=Schizosaccharomyces japonicus (strain yFS275 / FY16936) TaxID=402676 RepID=T0RSV7_SCHJY|nr:hypothetical protein SJAG_06355 [Schizosaccharomyces japonicus yFS275]EQC53030.1 hypothetical protein SJAG_06355 [Schizosaccharomyces japonicus yFS275]